MKRILYFSTASAELIESDIEAIVEQAQINNAAQQVTGALGYNGRNFCQLLEGSPCVLDTLVDKISKDPRHTGFKVLDEKPIAERAFPSWTMQRVNDLDFQVVIDAMKY